VANCFIGMFALLSPSLSCTVEIAPLRSFVLCVYCGMPFAELNVMNSRGSWMKFIPTLKSWPRPHPDFRHEKSSRN
jgi:hypothetical protein